MTAWREGRSDAVRWLTEAEEEVATARTILDSGQPARTACFLAHLAAEKALKAILIHADGEATRTHDLVGLLKLVPEASRKLFKPEPLQELNFWSVRGRYPGDAPEADRPTAARMIELARATVAAAQAVVLGGLR